MEWNPIQKSTLTIVPTLCPLPAALCDMYLEHVREISEPGMRAKMHGDAAAAEKWLAEDLPQVFSAAPISRRRSVWRRPFFQSRLPLSIHPFSTLDYNRHFCIRRLAISH